MSRVREIARELAGEYAREARGLSGSRDARKRAVRARTLRLQKLPLYERHRQRLLHPDADEAHESRPRTRGECEHGIRPCPYVSCRHHLYLDVTPSGNLTLNFPDLDVDELKETCSLDVVDRRARTLEEVGELLNVTRERVRQIEDGARERFGLRIRRRVSEEDVLE